MAKKRGNPNWGWGTREMEPVTPAIAEFQRVAREFNLQPDEYISSTQLREWASVNKNSKFIPETLLKAWGLEAESKL
jgi:hypothetical protein